MRKPLLLFGLVALSIGAAAPVTIVIDASTTLLDFSLFTAGTTYYAAFQLSGSGINENTAVLSAFQFGGGGAVDRDAADPLFGLFVLAPDDSAPSGIGQPSALLNLTVNLSEPFALYTQRFVAGSEFSFDFEVSQNYTPGFPPDQFSFQLYDEALRGLLHETVFDIQPSEPAPEPELFWLTGVALLAVGVRSLKRDVAVFFSRVGSYFGGEHAKSAD